MNIPMFPDRVKTFVRLWPALSTIYEALEFGTQKAIEYFETENAEINPYLAASLVRWNARRFIESRADEVPVVLDEIANIGLRMSYEDHHIWVLKTDEGELPTPGSPVKVEFYEQVLPLLIEAAEDAPYIRPNLVVLWSASRTYTALSLQLACPKPGNVTSEFDCYWKEPIPHPAELIDFEMPVDADAATQEELTAIENFLFKKAEGDDE